MNGWNFLLKSPQVKKKSPPLQLNDWQSQNVTFLLVKLVWHQLVFRMFHTCVFTCISQSYPLENQSQLLSLSPSLSLSFSRHTHTVWNLMCIIKHVISFLFLTHLSNCLSNQHDTICICFVYFLFFLQFFHHHTFLFVCTVALLSLISTPIVSPFSHMLLSWKEVRVPCPGDLLPDFWDLTTWH